MPTKGDRIRITNDEILNQCMGLPVATGVVFLVTPRALHFQCDQTRAIEIVELEGSAKIELM